MAKTKSKFAKDKPLSLEVSNAIRHHVGCKLVEESKKENAIADRDAAVAELAACTNKHSPEAIKLKERHSDSVIKIEDHNKAIKHHSGQITRVVTHADEPELDFQYDVPDEPRPRAGESKGQMQLADPAKSDPRPVGRPAPVKPAEPKVADGVDEHLKVSVNELDMKENLKGKLTQAGLTTVGHIAALMDMKDFDLEKTANLNQNQAAEVIRAVKAFRKDHRKAMAEADGAAAPIAFIGGGRR